MSEMKDIKRASRKVFKNPFLREVSYMFHIESSPIFESKLAELKNFAESQAFKVRQVGADGMWAFVASKKGLDVLMTQSLLTVRVGIDEYKNYDVFKEFLIPFVNGCADVLHVDQIDNLVILKTNKFELKRDNEVAKRLTIEQYCESLFSPSFLFAYADKGVLRSARGLKVSAQDKVAVSDEALKVELLVGCLDTTAFKVGEMKEKIDNANDALFDMWSYAISKTMKDVLQKEVE